MNLFVANISRAVKEEALKALFSEFGPVSSVKILADKYTGESKGFGFVEMANDNHALEAIRKLSNAEFFGRRLVVSKARPRAAA
ncbi:RNA-binding protein [Chryseolinea sp. T2]|uniref:RNA recognition motif domain-containing protein n=1 Tax=Chryseolinea sp. T2 TaxID=3129255 RepID=UPI00307796D0